MIINATTAKAAATTWTTEANATTRDNSNKCNNRRSTKNAEFNSFTDEKMACEGVNSYFIDDSQWQIQDLPEG